MRSESIVGVVCTWIGFYTAGLPASAAARRAEEIAADVHAQIDHERRRGTGEQRIALAILARTIRGATDDLAWRWSVQPPEGGMLKLWIALLAAALVIGALALALDSPLLVLLAVAVVGLNIVAVLASGIASARRRGLVVPFAVILAAALGIAALAVGAIIVGDRGDAPGLVLLGVVLLVSVIVGALGLGMRSAQRSR